MRSFISKCVCVVYIVSEVLHITSIQCVHSNPDSVCVSLWIIQDSNRHRFDVLWLVSNICVCVQSIVWPVLHTCSARLDVFTFQSLTACWCSFFVLGFFQFALCRFEGMYCMGSGKLLLLYSLWVQDPWGEL